MTDVKVITRVDRVNLNTFLKLGYFLKYKNPVYSIDISRVNRRLFENTPENELIQKGVDLLRASISANYVSGEKHVVPISGGLDSRFILAGLLEHTEALNIYTYTFGTPGTYDFEIGNSLAEQFGTRHTQLPLTQYVYQMDELIDISKRIDHQTVLFLHPPLHKIDEYFHDCFIWSGWLGGELGGAHLPLKPAPTVEEGKRKFLQKNCFVSSLCLQHIDEKTMYPLIDCDYPCLRHLSFEEQFDFKNRQLKYIAPHILPNGFNYKLPFIYQELMDFMLSIPDRYRQGKYLFKKMLLKAFPQFFKFGTKENLGLPLDAYKLSIFARRVRYRVQKEVNKFITVFNDPGLNYIDFNIAIREMSDFKKVIYNNVMDLKSRQIIDGLDIEKIWRRHIDKHVNHGDALLILASLEIHLKAGKEI